MGYNLISHSQELNGSLKLWDHLNQVVNAAESIVAQKSLGFSGISKQQIADICRIAAVSHDFGKSTSFFQDYINSKSQDRYYEGGQQEKSHALISAFFGFNLVEKWLLNNQLESHWNAFIPFAVFVAIEGHHTTYKSIDEIVKRANDNFDLMEKQIANVNPEIFEYKFCENIDLSTCRDFNIEQIDNISSKLRKFGRDYRKVPKGLDKDKWLDIQIEHRILALFLYSALLEADKAYLASDNPNQYDRKPIPISGDLVDKYINKISDNKLINVERAKAYKNVIQSIDQIPLEQRIHSITLPTGLGKTLLSASWALKLRNRIEKEWDFSPKIIVSLPFLSIIEQTDEEYKQFLKEIYAKYGERLYFSSYSISDFRYRDGVDDFERSESSIDFFLGIWNAEMIITTYDQLLYSLFSLKPKYLMRFHNLINSIIIFDEVQALPSELWIPFEKFFSKLAEVGRSHILLMSATQPGFMPEAIERVPNHKGYFKRRNRIQLDITPKKENLEAFLEELPDLLKSNDDKSMMIVLNTRESSKKVFKCAAKILNKMRPIFYLSSLVAPSQRKDRILKIKDAIKANEKPLIVTTQCIEAGVDIDVDYIIRDWAPLDSIFQVCGRCNRNGLKELGLVEIRMLESDKGRAFSEMIYDNIALDSTAFSLKETGVKINENCFYELGSNYFKLVKEGIGESMKIVNSYAQYSHRYDDNGKDVTIDIKKILRDDNYQEQFLISVLDPELELKIKEAFKINDPWQKRYALKKLRKRIAANSVNVSFYQGMQINADDLTSYKIGKFRILDKRFYEKDSVGLDINPMEPISGCIISSEEGL